MNRKLSPYWMLAMLTGLNLFNYLDRYVLPAVVIPLQNELRLNDEQAGSLTSQFILGYFLAAPVFGYLGDRFSRKWLIAAGILVWSAGTMLTGAAQTLGALLVCRVLVGFGEASYATISPSLISDRFEGEARNNALTIFYVAIPVGSALGYIIGGQIADHHSWRNAFLWAGAPGLLLALLLLPFREERRQQQSSEPRAKPAVTDIFKLFLLPRFLLVVLGYTAFTFAAGGFAAWGPKFFVKAHGMPLAAAATFFGIMLVVTGLVGTFTGGFIASAWHKRNAAGYALTLGWSILLSGLFAFAAFIIPDRLLSQACLALSMFFLFFSTGPVNTLILGSVPANLHASAMAVSIFVTHLLGDWKSSEIVGSFSDKWDLPRAVLILPGALLVGAAFWLALALVMRNKPAVQNH